MLFVATFGGGQRQQDVAFFAGAPSCEVAVHRGLGLFVDQILAPSAQIRRTGVRMRSRDCLFARLATRHFIAVHGRIMADGPHVPGVVSKNQSYGESAVRSPITMARIMRRFHWRDLLTRTGEEGRRQPAGFGTAASEVYAASRSDDLPGVGGH